MMWYMLLKDDSGLWCEKNRRPAIRESKSLKQLSQWLVERRDMCWWQCRQRDEFVISWEVGIMTCWGVLWQILQTDFPISTLPLLLANLMVHNVNYITSIIEMFWGVTTYLIKTIICIFQLLLQLSEAMRYGSSQQDIRGSCWSGSLGKLFKRKSSKTLVCEHNSFQKQACHLKHPSIKANFKKPLAQLRSCDVGHPVRCVLQGTACL